MSEDVSVKLNSKGLDKLIRMMTQRLPVGRLGILGSDNVRGDAGSNAQIGAMHEFGIGVPVRSFLRLPLMAMLPKYLEKDNPIDKVTLRKVVEIGSAVPVLENLLATGEQVVWDAFESGGFGTWVPSDMTHKENDMTLVETGKLQRSITFEVK